MSSNYKITDQHKRDAIARQIQIHRQLIQEINNEMQGTPPNTIERFQVINRKYHHKNIIKGIRDALAILGND